MLRVANARRLHVSTCLHRRLPSKRRASLTGAIERGARKAINARHRMERVYTGPDSDVEESFSRQQSKGPHRSEVFGRVKTDSRKGQEDSGYVGENPRWNARGGRPSERFFQMKGDRGSSPQKFSPLRPSPREGRRGNSEPRRSARNADKITQGHQPAGGPTDLVHDTVDSIWPAERQATYVKKRSTVPISIPRSSAASEFIYGTSAVKAALQAGTRKLYKLYIHQGATGAEQRRGDATFFELADTLGLHVKKVDGDGLRLLDKMARGRPHNGYVLEASQLPSTPADALDNVLSPGDGFSFKTAHQSAEEIAVNGTSQKIPSSSRRYPFVLLLDNILDPGNLGAIVRSAAFFGVDAIALTDYNLAPFSPVTLKASCGAAEHMRYLKVRNDHDFVKRSQGNGWKFFAAVAPESRSASRGRPDAIPLNDVEDALTKSPCVLMLGGEGDGLRPRLQRAADAMVGIEGAGWLSSSFGLDSLNVSVAAGLLIQTFLRDSNTSVDTRGMMAEPRSSEDVGQLF